MSRVLAVADRCRVTHRFSERLNTLLSFALVEVVARGMHWPILFVLPLFLSPSEYGTVRLIVAIEMIVAAALLFGQDRLVLRYYRQDEDRATLLRTILTVCGTTSLAMTALLAICGFVWERIAGVPVFPHLILLLPAIAFLDVNQICMAVSRADQSSWQFAQFRIGLPLFKFLGVVGATWILGNSLGYVIGLLFGLLLLSLSGVPYLYRRAHGSFDRMVAMRLVRFGWPFLFHVLGASLLGYVSLFMLQAMADKEAVGLYGFAVTVGSLVFFVYAGLSSYFEPMIYRFADDCDRRERWLAVFGLASTAVASAASIALILPLHSVVSSVFSTEYLGTLPLIPPVLGAILSRPVYLQGNYRLVAHARPEFIATGTVLAGIANVASCWLLIPSFGIRGAAVAFCFSSVLLACYLYLASLRVGGVPWRSVRGAWSVPVILTGCLALASSPRIEVSLVILGAICFVSTTTLIPTLRESRRSMGANLRDVHTADVMGVFGRRSHASKP